MLGLVSGVFILGCLWEFSGGFRSDGSFDVVLIGLWRLNDVFLRFGLVLDGD